MYRSQIGLNVTIAQAPLAEITTTAIRILCREIGAANTAPFLGQFTTGFGNYTEDRDEILGEPTVDEVDNDPPHRRKPDFGDPTQVVITSSRSLRIA